MRFLLFLVGATLLPVSPVAMAYLPDIGEKPWVGYFLGHQERKFRFGLNIEGKGLIQPMRDRKKPVGERTCPTVEVVIEELVPGRSPVRKKIQPMSLESSDPPTTTAGKVTYRGKVTGDAAFEVVLENDRGDFAIGGRITDPGKLKNPLRFSVRVQYRGIYYKPKKNKAFEKKASKDRLDLVWTDGKKVKFDGFEKVDAKSDEVNGPGIQEIDVDFSPYEGNEFVFKASPNSSMRLWNNKSDSLYKGFSINWFPDPAKDPEHQARLHFTVK